MMATYSADVVDVVDLGAGRVRITCSIVANRDYSAYPAHACVVEVDADATPDEIVAAVLATPSAVAFVAEVETAEAALALAPALPVQPGAVLDLDAQLGAA